MSDPLEDLFGSPAPAKRRAPTDYKSLYQEVGTKHGVDPDLLYRQAKQESSLNPRAVGPPTKYGTAKGMAQFIPTTAREYGLRVGNGVDDRLDPAKAADAQARLMRKLIDRYGDERLALSAYNSGTNRSPQSARRAMERIPETRNYVQKIAGGRTQRPTAPDPLSDLFDAPAAASTDPVADLLEPVAQPVQSLPPAQRPVATGGDVAHHFGIGNDEWAKMSRRQQRKVQELAVQAATEDQRKRAAGQTDFPVSPEYQNQMRVRAGLRTEQPASQGRQSSGESSTYGVPNSRILEETLRNSQGSRGNVSPEVSAALTKIFDEKGPNAVKPTDNLEEWLQRRLGLNKPAPAPSVQSPLRGALGMTSAGNSNLDVVTPVREAGTAARIRRERPMSKSEARRADDAEIELMRRTAEEVKAGGGAPQNSDPYAIIKDNPNAEHQEVMQRVGEKVRRHGSAAGAMEAEAVAAEVESQRKARVANMGTGEKLAQIPKSVIGSVYESAGAGLKGMAVLGKKAARAGLLGPHASSYIAEGDTKDSTAYQLGETIIRDSKEMLGSNPDLEKDWLYGKGPNVLGQAATVLLGGAVTKAPKLASMIIGGGMNASSAYDEVIASGGNEDEAVNAGLLAGAILTPTELLGLHGTIQAVKGSAKAATIRAAMKEGLKTGSRDVIENGIEGLGQELGMGEITGNRRSGAELAEASVLEALGGTVSVPLSAGAKLPGRARVDATQVKADFTSVIPQPKTLQVGTEWRKPDWPEGETARIMESVNGVLTLENTKGQRIQVPEEALQKSVEKGSTLPVKAELSLRQPVETVTQPATHLPVEGAIANTPSLPTGDRRVDVAQRQRVSELSNEQMQKELLTSHVVDLPNARAYEEAPKKAVQGRSDVDGLSWVNDNLSHEAGNELLKAKAQALKDEGVDSYHVSGDEFSHQFDTQAEADTKMQAVADRLSRAKITVTTPDGKVHEYTGASFSKGTGKDGQEAEAGLQKDKTARRESGERAAVKGGQPPRLVETTQRTGEIAKGQQVENRSPAEVATGKEVIPSEAFKRQAQKEGTQDVSQPVSSEAIKNQLLEKSEGGGLVKETSSPESLGRDVATASQGENQPSSTAAKREKVTADRAARGDEAIPKSERKADTQLLDDAKRANDADRSEPMRLADQVLNGKKGALSDKETVQLDLHVQGLKNKYDTVNKELASAKTPEQISELSERSDAMEREMRVAEEAWAASGTEKGRALRAQRIEIDNDFRLLTMTSKATKARGRELTLAERATIKEQHAKIETLEKRLLEANDRATRAEAEKATARIKDDIAKENRRGSRVRRKGNLDEQAAQIRQQIAQAWAKQKSGGTEIHSAMGLAKLDPEGEVTKLVVELAKNRIHANVGLKAEALVDEVHGLLKDAVNLSRREVAEMISGYGKTFQMSQEVADVRLRELKSIIASNLGKADIIEKGIRPLRRGLQRDKPSQEVREAMRELRDTLKEHGLRVEKGKGSPEEQQKSSLDAAKTQTRNRIEDLSKWIADGKRTVGTKSEVIPDAELRGLRAERDRLQKVFEAIDDPAADQRKLENALRSANKSVAELESKINRGDLAVKSRGVTVTSPELEAARAEQKALRGIINDLRKAAQTPADPIEVEARKLLSANKSLNTRMEKQIADFERRMKQGDFSTTPKREQKVYNQENLRLQKQLEQVKQEYQRANYKATRGRGGMVLDEIAKVGNLPKTLKSMGDISAVFRQGGFYSVTHPVEGLFKPTANMLRSFSEAGHENVKEAIKNHPKYDQAKRDGVEFTGVDKTDTNLSHKEEGFFAGETIDALASIPVVGYAFKPVRAVKGFSERTFVSFLDSQRLNMYDLMTDGLKAQGLTPRNAPDSYKGAAKLINAGTGRGNLGKTGNQAAPLLNVAMFSPRLVASRAQMLNNMFNPVAMARKPKGIREQNIKDNVKFLAATSVVMGLATALGGSVNRDPDDADFLKIRFGKTTYDTLTGLQQPMRYILNMYRAATGGDTYPGQDMGDLTKRFARSKASPLAGLAVDAISGEDFQGRQFSKKRAALDVVTPLPIKDFKEAMEKEGLIKGFVKALPATTGIGVQTYDERPDKPTTRAEKLARKLMADKMPDSSRTDEQIDLDKKRADLRSRSRKGEDVSMEVGELLRSGQLSKEKAQVIIKARNQTRFQEDLKRLGADDALTVYRVMTPDEKKIALPMILSKMRNSEAPAPQKQAFIQKARQLGVTQ